MKEILRKLCKYVEANAITEKQWDKIWKTMNLTRLLCEHDFQNIISVMSLEGIRYFRKVIVEFIAKKEAKENALDVVKEIVREFDIVINGLISHGDKLTGEIPNIILGNIQENSTKRASRFRVLIMIVVHVYKNNEGYIKI